MADKEDLRTASFERMICQRAGKNLTEDDADNISCILDNRFSDSRASRYGTSASLDFRASGYGTSASSSLLIFRQRRN
ncbi:hypothetical protein L1887_39810 [Cichorium endivia]|nr:hypothetical protein L1887_39810 [Cichorium endivia]